MTRQFKWVLGVLEYSSLLRSERVCPSQNSYAEALVLKANAFGGRASERWQVLRAERCHEGGAP